jgi:zinc/manganese transport system substrate-binding protein
MRKFFTALSLTILLISVTACSSGPELIDATVTPGKCPITPIKIVSTLNQWGSIAKTVGGDCVQVTNIVEAGKDPHDYELTSKDMQSILGSDLLIVNGLSVDHWVDKTSTYLSNSKPNSVINIGNATLDYTQSNNPHIWFNQYVIFRFAETINNKLVEMHPEISNYINIYSKFIQDYKTKFQTQNDLLITKYDNKTYADFENLPEYLFMDVRITNATPADFASAVNSETDPSAKAISEFQKLIKGKSLDLLIYNESELNKTTKSLLKLANDNKVKTFGMTEAMPENFANLFEWVLNIYSQLNS